MNSRVFGTWALLTLGCSSGGCDGPGPRLPPPDSGVRELDAFVPMNDAFVPMNDASTNPDGAGPPGLPGDAGPPWLPSDSATEPMMGCVETGRYALGSIVEDATSFLSVRISHDGTRVALRVHRSVESGVAVAPLDGRAGVQLVGGLPDNPGLAWSPDDTQVFYNGSDVSRVAVDSMSRPTALVSGFGANNLDVSSDGRFVIYDQFDIYRLDTVRGGMPIVFWDAPPVPPARPGMQERFSPDSMHIAFMQDNGASDPRTERGELQIIHAGTGAAERTIRPGSSVYYASSTSLAWPRENRIFISGARGARGVLTMLDITSDDPLPTIAYTARGDGEIATFDVHPDGTAVVGETNPISGASEMVVLRCGD